MGDRTYCTLTFWKVTNVPEYQALMRTIVDMLGYPEFQSGAPNELGFYEVNWGMLSADIKTDLRNRGFSYTWEWESGGGYPAGIEMYDAASNTAAQFTTVDGSIVLDLDQATYPDTLKNARDWDSCLKKPKNFAVIDSPNDDFLINLVKEKSEDVA